MCIDSHVSVEILAKLFTTLMILSRTSAVAGEQVADGRAMAKVCSGEVVDGTCKHSILKGCIGLRI